MQMNNLIISNFLTGKSQRFFVKIIARVQLLHSAHLPRRQSSNCKSRDAGKNQTGNFCSDTLFQAQNLTKLSFADN
jgi:hypothetical protein